MRAEQNEGLREVQKRRRRKLRGSEEFIGPAEAGRLV